MATEPRVPKSKLQGSNAKPNTRANTTSKSNGNTAPKGDTRKTGVTPKPRGGSGTGSHRGDSLPR